MSRTKRGGKRPGYEYWSARPGSSRGVGAKATKATHRAERQQNKKATAAGCKEVQE